MHHVLLHSDGSAGACGPVACVGTVVGVAVGGARVATGVFCGVLVAVEGKVGNVPAAGCSFSNRVSTPRPSAARPAILTTTTRMVRGLERIW